MWIIIATFEYQQIAYNMVKLALGFSGERFIYLPLNKLDDINNSKLTGDLYVYSLGHFAEAKHHFYSRPTGCEQHILIYCVKGEGWINIKGKKYTLSENQCIVLQPNTMHSYGASDDSPWSIYWTHFMGAKAELYAQKLNTPTSLSTIKYGHSKKRTRINLFEEIYTTLRSGFTDDNMNYANACFVHYLATFIYPEQYTDGESNSEYSKSIINRATYFMDENIHRKLTIDDISSHVGYSPSYFYRKFVKEIGCSPLEYFIRLKIQHACQYLLGSDFKISQIASMLGFSDSHYFSRIFLKKMGLSPMHYRKNHNS